MKISIFAQASDLQERNGTAAVGASEKCCEKLRRFGGRREPVTGCEDMAKRSDFCGRLKRGLFGFDQLALQGVMGLKTALAHGLEHENSKNTDVCCGVSLFGRGGEWLGLWWQKSPEKCVIGNKYAKKSEFLSLSLVTKINFCLIFGGRQW